MKRLLLFLLLLTTPAWAGEEHDHDRAERALRSGEVMPLGRILEAIERDFQGDFLEVELEGEHGRWVYEVKLLSPQGSVLKLVYDARTAELLKARGHGVDTARRKP
ncbi:MAG TPA: PepSY domain-containing protein [Azospirillaceae bacterium]|nr:PepSY domain-containing protein [Azospirillaceae bacterium]